MDELESLKARLQTLEAVAQVNDDYRNSLKHLLFHALQTLHKQRLVRMQDIADSAEGAAAFGLLSYQMPKMTMLAPLVQALRDVGNALDALSAQSPPPSGSGDPRTGG